MDYGSKNKQDGVYDAVILAISCFPIGVYAIAEIPKGTVATVAMWFVVAQVLVAGFAIAESN